ncbi:MAG TPA: DUF6786 family protein [Labilithrix sp.]
MLAACGGRPLGPGPAELASAQIPVPPPERPKAKQLPARKTMVKPMPEKSAAAPTFGDDLAFLEKNGEVKLLEGPKGEVVAVSAKYQGRVMTSAIERSGRSFGWINRTFIQEGKTGTPFDNYGGEDRFWLGPEAGQFGLYFPPGSDFKFDAWQVPHAMQEGAWDVADAKKSSIVFKKKMSVTNWSNASFDVEVERKVSLLSPDEAKTALGADVLGAKDVKGVAFVTKNTIKNAGPKAWTKETGLVSIWVLAMYAPAADGHVVVPFDKNGKGKIVSDDYFGKVPADRLKVREDKGVILFTVDGKLRSKIGLAPDRAKRVLGSYSPEAKLLTIVQYDKPDGKKPYVNSMWEKQKDPFAGDVVNSYNDGPIAPGKPPLGGFYELETSSPAAELAPGATLTHSHRTFHLVGEQAALEPIAKAVLGVSLADLQ